jgi:cell division transport system permease protein
MISRLLQSFFRSWREHAAMQSATLAVLTGTFVVVTLFFFLHGNMVKILTQWGNNVRMAVFIKDDATAEQVASVQRFLEDTGSFATVSYVSKEQAARKFQEQMGSHSPQLLNDPEFGNPLPASFEAKFNDGVNSKGRYEDMLDLAKKIGVLAGVEDVSYGQGWVENYASLLKVFSSSSWILIIILLSGSLFVVGNAIRSTLFQRRDEIEVLELVGATPYLIRAPYIFEGAVMGFVAAALSIVICFALFRWQQSMTAAHLGFWGLAAEIGFLGWKESFAILMLGIWFGAFGSFLCVRRIATGWAAAQRE